MIGSSIKAAGQQATGFLVKNSPSILTGLGVVGTISSVVMAVRATPKAIDLIKEAEFEKGDQLTKWETVQTSYKCYIPTVLTTTTAIGCIIGANTLNLQRQAVLTAGYTLANAKLGEYQQKVVETIGPRKEQGIREAIGEDHIRNNPTATNQIFLTGRGNVLMYDDFSARYFRSDIDTIRKIQNDLNQRMLSEMSVSINDFYSECGLEQIGNGDDYGWNAGEDLMDITFAAKVSDDGEPCIILLYEPCLLMRSLHYGRM